LIKLNLGCGSNILESYENIDRYVENSNVKNYDILNLPFPDNSVDEILAEHLVEHLSFAEEKLFFCEAKRVLAEWGVLKIEVPDIEWVFSEFIKQKDLFHDFYQVGAYDHYFGNGPGGDNKWGVLTTHIWGNQNGVGQFHKNGYTEKKCLRIGELMGFRSSKIKRDFKKKTQVLICEYEK
jgi:hypothetical protein